MKPLNINQAKTFFTKIALASFLLILSFACSNSDSLIDIGKPLLKVEQPKQLNVIGHWLGEGEREVLVRNFAREYEFQNQHVNVNLKFPEEVYYDQLDRKSNEKYTAKVVSEGITDWDILRINGEYSEVLGLLGDPNWAKNHLVDFSQIDEFRKGTNPELLTPEALEKWNGIIPGPWLEGQYWALWCNNNVAKKVGIEVKQYGMTFDDFLSYIKAVDKHNKANPNDYIAPIFESYVWETAECFAVNLYGSLLDNLDEFLSKKITDKRLYAWGKTLEALEQLAPYKPLKKDWRTTEWSDTKASLLNEECLFYINGSWMYNIWMGIDEKKTLDCMPVEFPSFKPLTFYPGAYQITWGVPKNAPNKDEAVKFLLAMNKPSMAEVWVRTTKCPTGIKGNLSNATFGADKFESFSAHVQSTYGLNTYRYFESSAWFLDEKNSETENYFKPILEGDITASEAMKRIRKSIGR
jgi:hypothetical protein